MQSQFSTSSVSNRNIQHGDTVGANPAQAPQVSNSTFINDNDPRLDQETTRGKEIMKNSSKFIDIQNFLTCCYFENSYFCHDL